MMYKAKVAVCSEIRTKHSTQSERHVEFLNVKPNPLGFKRLIVYVAVSSTGARVVWLCYHCFCLILGRIPVWDLVADADCCVVVVSWFHPVHPDE